MLANKENGTGAANCRKLKNSIIDDHADVATDNDDDGDNDDEGVSNMCHRTKEYFYHNRSNSPLCSWTSLQWKGAGWPAHRFFPICG